jgi:hypothetical protein
MRDLPGSSTGAGGGFKPPPMGKYSRFTALQSTSPRLIFVSSGIKSKTFISILLNAGLFFIILTMSRQQRPSETPFLPRDSRVLARGLQSVQPPPILFLAGSVTGITVSQAVSGALRLRMEQDSRPMPTCWENLMLFTKIYAATGTDRRETTP